jgi:hypothetical protein
MRPLLLRFVTGLLILTIETSAVGHLWTACAAELTAVSRQHVSTHAALLASGTAISMQCLHPFQHN